MGFAENVKYVISTYVKTEYVMIVQHDQMFIKRMKLCDLLACMNNNGRAINYLGFASETNNNEVNNRLVAAPFKKIYKEFLMDFLII